MHFKMSLKTSFRTIFCLNDRSSDSSIVQGITEFLPISSSSHLIIISKFTNFQEQSLSIDVSMYIGSFLAVITYFKKKYLILLKIKNYFIKFDIINTCPNNWIFAYSNQFDTRV